MKTTEEFLKLFLRHQGDLRAFLGSVVRDRAAAEDLFQEISLVLWQSFGSYDRSRPFGAWARGIAVKKVLQGREKSRRLPLALSPQAIQAVLDAYDRTEDLAPDPSDLRDCISKLPPRSQSLLALRYETNSGGAYRATEGVDIEITSDAGSGYNVCWLSPGEWLQYTVNVAATGTYDISFRVASATTGGTMHLSSGAANLTGTVTVPGTGGWQTWQTVTATGVALSAGTQALRLVFDSGSFNINSMTFASAAPASAPPPAGGAGVGGAPRSKSGGGGLKCGLTGLETVGLLGLLALRRRRKV